MLNCLCLLIYLASYQVKLLREFYSIYINYRGNILPQHLSGVEMCRNAISRDIKEAAKGMILEFNMWNISFYIKHPLTEHNATPKVMLLCVEKLRLIILVIMFAASWFQFTNCRLAVATHFSRGMTIQITLQKNDFAPFPSSTFQYFNIAPNMVQVSLAALRTRPMLSPWFRFGAYLE